MEFVQYHPTGLPATGILITEATRAEGGWLLNKDGYRYLQDYDLGTPQPEPVLRSMELGPRDRLSQAFIQEQQKGRTLEGPYGPYVNLDIRHIGEARIDQTLPFVRELCLKYAGLDPVKEMIPVRPVVHYMMGGVHTDITGATPLAGLYAAGEAACVNLNGANRLGSNSLTECLVFGARAGRAAAAFAETLGPSSPSVGAQARDEAQRLSTMLAQSAGGTERIATLRTEMQQTLEESAGIYRTGARLDATAQQLRGLQDRVTHLRLEDRSRTFNTELTSALELAYMLDLAEVIVESAKQRTESRGAHQRTDYPARDDQRFLTPLAGVPDARRLDTDRVLARDDHALATRPARLRKVADGRHSDTDRVPVSSRAGSGACLSELRGPVPGGLGLARRDQLHQRLHRWIAFVPMVVPHGRVRELRDDGRRQTRAHLRLSHVALHAWSSPNRTVAVLPDRARPRDRYDRLHGEAQARQAVDHPR